jgi:hypothetical protein
MPDSLQPSPELNEYVQLVLQVASSRARFVINKILQQGFITSQEIQDQGFMHGARAIGDVRDNGVPIITLKIKSDDGRTIARYELGPASDIKRNKLGGRIAFPASLKKHLLIRDGSICAISEQELPENQLQVDHRIPFYISGDIENSRNPDEFMLLSRYMQRSKSWACENCENLKQTFEINICRRCYWAYPKQYEHIAMREERRVDIVFVNGEVGIIDRVRVMAEAQHKSIQALIKELLASSLDL